MTLFALLILSSCLGKAENEGNRAVQRGDSEHTNVTFHEGDDEENPDGKAAHIIFTSTSYVQADVLQGELVTHQYEFKNTGEGFLKIYAVSSDCDCVEASYPDYLIAPGETDYIEMTFNSDGYEGEIERSLLINSNAENGNAILRFFCNVIQ